MSWNLDLLFWNLVQLRFLLMEKISTAFITKDFFLFLQIFTNLIVFTNPALFVLYTTLAQNEEDISVLSKDRQRLTFRNLWGGGL